MGMGGKFIERRPLKTADKSRRLNLFDFVVGNPINLNSFRFIIIDASDFTYQYLENAKHPESDIERCMEQCRAAVAGQTEDSVLLLEDFEKTVADVIPELTPHAIRTIARHFGQGDPQAVGVNAGEWARALA